MFFASSSAAYGNPKIFTEVLDQLSVFHRERSEYVLTSAKPMKRSRKDRNKRKNRKAAAKTSKKRNR